MKKRYIFAGVLALLGVGAGAAVYVLSPTVHPGASGEAPRLGQTGDYTVGTVEREFALPDRTTITVWGAVSGNLESTDRRLSVRFWYPAAQGTEGDPAQYAHQMNIAGNDPINVISQGIAYPDAAPLAGERFPLILMSHGFGGWKTQFSNLGEHLASQGYVVASIDHAEPAMDGVTSALLSFGNVLVDRTLDQRQVLSQIIAEAGGADSGYSALIDAEKIGLIGYSMGGYGAIASAGAPYIFDNSPISNIPDAAQKQLQEVGQEPLPIQALVAFAPWGGQPKERVWSKETLAKIDVPVLLISGDQDDIVNFDEGVSWLFDNLSGTARYMLVFREARHNIVGNEFTVAPDAPFNAAEFLKEPVWRGDRLNTINQHFVTAFLDWQLKGDAEKESYLNVPTIDSNKGEWPVSFGEQLNGKRAGAEESGYWKGFQRRWAVGLEMRKAEAGK